MACTSGRLVIKQAKYLLKIDKINNKEMRGKENEKKTGSFNDFGWIWSE